MCSVTMHCCMKTDQACLFCGMKGGIFCCAERQIFCTLRTHTAVVSSYATIVIFAVIFAVIEIICHLLFSSWHVFKVLERCQMLLRMITQVHVASDNLMVYAETAVEPFS